jgi:hypothetical protein
MIVHFIKQQPGAIIMKTLLILSLLSILIFTSCSNNNSNPVNTAPIPSAAILLSPGDASTAITVTPNFTWNASSGATSYKLQVSVNSSFSSFVYNQGGLTNLSQQISGLDPLSIYYWRVNASNNAGTSDWSTVWSFTTTGPSPIVPVLSSPVNNSTIYSAPLSLTWIASSGATSYTLQVSLNSSFTSFVYNQTGLTTLSQQVTGLTASTYYWRISANNNYGQSGWSIVWSFTTNAPTAPFLSTPVNGAINQSVSPSLNWSASSGATSFTLQVSLNSSFTSFVFNQSGLTSLNQQVTGLTAQTLYYWRLSAANDYGTSGWSNTWSFTTQ